MKNFLFFLFSASVFSCLLCAGTKEDLLRVQNDVLTLQTQLRMLQKSVDENSGLTKALVGQLQDQMTKMGRTVDDTRNTQMEQSKSGNDNIEDLLNEIRSLAVKIDDLEQKVGVLYKKMDTLQTTLPQQIIDAAGKTGAQTQSSGTTTKNSGMSAEQLFSLAYNDYIQGNYDMAVQGFKELLKVSSDYEQADKASYYIGDCFYNQSKWNEAVEAFNNMTSLYPKSEQAPAAYLKCGLAYISLEDQNSAIKQFNAVVLKYPDSTEANIAMEKLQALGAAPPPATKKPPKKRRTT